jgi:uncharacterized protein YprB with RNaseH-like and TPR domain
MFNNDEIMTPHFKQILSCAISRARKFTVDDNNVFTRSVNEEYKNPTLIDCHRLASEVIKHTDIKLLSSVSVKPVEHVECEELTKLDHESDLYTMYPALRLYYKSPKVINRIYDKVPAALWKDFQSIQSFTDLSEPPHLHLHKYMNLCAHAVIEDDIIRVAVKEATIDEQNLLIAMLSACCVRPTWNFDNTRLIICDDKQSYEFIGSRNMRMTGMRLLYAIMTSLIDKTNLNVKFINFKIAFDFETTGLHKTCDVIERTFIEMNTGLIISNGLINISTYLPDRIREITGITQHELDTEGDKLSVMINELSQLMRVSKVPTFVAHNGNLFDFPILKRDLRCHHRQCLYIFDFNTEDSLVTLRRRVPALSSYKLENIYNHLQLPPVRAHRSEADVHMIIRIYKNLNLI